MSAKIVQTKELKAKNALMILNNPSFLDAFEDVTELFIQQIFTVETSQERDVIAAKKKGLDDFYAKLKQYINEQELETLKNNEKDVP